jgi:microcystin-dependent protein
MALEPFVGEIRAMSFNFAPKGWAACNGQLLPIQQNQALFSILGTIYGGNGTTNFALPNLQGSVPVGFGPSPLGSKGGSAQVTLNVNQMNHTHAVGASATANTNTAAGHVPAPAGTGNLAYGTPPDTTMNPAVIQPAGGSQPHNNLQPYLVLNYCIALVGIFPSRD